ncbi:hypothetical protein MPTK2_7g00980 [Marchantia polymorpha subsp. ruderalis]
MQVKKACESVGVKMSLMNRLRSMKLKRQHSFEDEKDMEATAPSAAQRSRTAVGLFLGWAFVSWLGYDTGTGDAALATTAAFFGNARLLSEYYPPRRIHESLFHSRELHISKGGENTTYADELWNSPGSQGWKPCVKPQVVQKAPTNNGYFQVFCTGGLFQLHICVTNAVAVAKMLNATLVVPYFRDSGVWNDSSKFHDIYDIDHFIFSLKEYLPVVRDLPVDLDWSTPEYNDKCEKRPTCITYIPKHSNQEWYLENVLPVMQSYGLAATRKYHHKLTFDDLPLEVVKLRCFTNFIALRFVPSLRELSEKLVERIRAKAKLAALTKAIVDATTASRSSSVEPSQKPAQKKKGVSHHHKRRLLANKSASKMPNAGRFLGLHLRFEKDMISHSACYYDGGTAERKALSAYRRSLFQNRAEKAQFHSTYLRMNGSCPLSPEEAGLLLAGLGYDNSTIIYMAGESVYGGEARLKPLRDLFPLLETKESLAAEEELRPLKTHGLQLAALDFLVLQKSDVYMSTAAGNFPNVLTGHRTFFDFRKSIHPDKATLANLLTSNVTWSEFSKQVRESHSDRLGAATLRKPKYSVFRYPIPDCMCQNDNTLIPQ